jgi:hypothetical protein
MGRRGGVGSGPWGTLAGPSAFPATHASPSESPRGSAISAGGAHGRAGWGREVMRPLGCPPRNGAFTAPVSLLLQALSRWLPLGRRSLSSIASIGMAGHGPEGASCVLSPVVPALAKLTCRGWRTLPAPRGSMGLVVSRYVAMAFGGVGCWGGDCDVGGSHGCPRVCHGGGGGGYPSARACLPVTYPLPVYTRPCAPGPRVAMCCGSAVEHGIAAPARTGCLPPPHASSLPLRWPVQPCHPSSQLLTAHMRRGCGWL